jgi:hypothetical protein
MTMNFGVSVTSVLLFWFWAAPGLRALRRSKSVRRTWVGTLLPYSPMGGPGLLLDLALRR